MRDLFPLLSVLVFVLVVAGIVRTILRQFEIAELKRIGVPIVATVTEIERRTSTTRGVPPHQTTTTTQQFLVHAIWTNPADGTTREYRSDPVSWWAARRYAEGSRITVLLDPHEPERYYVDTSN